MDVHEGPASVAASPASLGSSPLSAAGCASTGAEGPELGATVTGFGVVASSQHTTTAGAASIAMAIAIAP
jgi:hypothetical protein